MPNPLHSWLSLCYIHQVFWTISAILQGGVYFKEFKTFSPQQTTGFGTGVLIILCGVYLLSPSTPIKGAAADTKLSSHDYELAGATKSTVCSGDGEPTSPLLMRGHSNSGRFSPLGPHSRDETSMSVARDRDLESASSPHSPGESASINSSLAKALELKKI